MRMSQPIRILVMGGRKVGKSAVSVRFMTQRFIGEYSSQKDFKYRANLAEFKSSIEVLDLSGDWTERSDLEIRELIQSANAWILVYDVCDRHSFNSIHKLLKTVIEYRVSYGPIAIMGNKRDLEAGRKVDFSEGKRIAMNFSSIFSETSAAEASLGIKTTFDKLIQTVVNLRGSLNKARQPHIIRYNTLSTHGGLSSSFPSSSSSGCKQIDANPWIMSSSYHQEVTSGQSSPDSIILSQSPPSAHPSGHKKYSLSSHFSIFGSVLNSTNRKSSISSSKNMSRFSHTSQT